MTMDVLASPKKLRYIRSSFQISGNFQSKKAAIISILDQIGDCAKPSDYVYYLYIDNEEQCYTCNDAMNIHRHY